MNKKEKIVYYSSLCAALVLHILLFVLLFFLQETPPTTQSQDNAPVIFEDEAGEAGTARGTPEGTEIAKESYTSAEQASADAETMADIPEETSESDEDVTESAAQIAPDTAEPEAPIKQLPTLYQPASTPRELPRGTVQPDTPIEYAAPVQQSDTPKKPKRRRAAWHVVSTEVRTRAAGLNIQQSIRTFTDQQYDAYGTPNGTGGSSDHGTGTGGGGNARYHATINSLDLIRQSYMRKAVRAIVAQSNFMQLMVYSAQPINSTTWLHVEISPAGKIISMTIDADCPQSMADGLRKIFYATQLPPLPSRLRDGFKWHAGVTMRHSAQMAPLILTAREEF